jgi:hypothetical protein
MSDYYAIRLEHCNIFCDKRFALLIFSDAVVDGAAEATVAATTQAGRNVYARLHQRREQKKALQQKRPLALHLQHQQQAAGRTLPLQGMQRPLTLTQQHLHKLLVPDSQLRESIERQEHLTQTLLFGLHEQALQNEKSKYTIGRRRTFPQSWQLAAAKKVLWKASRVKPRA